MRFRFDVCNYTWDSLKCKIPPPMPLKQESSDTLTCVQFVCFSKVFVFDDFGAIKCLYISVLAQN